MAEPKDIEMVTQLLGREPQGEFWVERRRSDGSPIVIRNAPILFSGRPMPTLYWLVDPQLVKTIGRLESTGAVKAVQEVLTLEEIQVAHDAYEARRDELLVDFEGPYKPSGGVGGTRRGVKCLHAHYANHLMGVSDPVGKWVHENLEASGDVLDETQPGVASEVAGE